MEKNDERFEKEKEFISMNIIMKCDESENKHDVVLFFLEGGFNFTSNLFCSREPSGNSMIQGNLPLNKTQALVSFFDILSIKYIASSVGLKLKLPK